MRATGCCGRRRSSPPPKATVEGLQATLQAVRQEVEARERDLEETRRSHQGIVGALQRRRRT